MRAVYLGAALAALSVAVAVIQYLVAPRPGPADPLLIVAGLASGAYMAIHAGMRLADPRR